MPSKCCSGLYQQPHDRPPFPVCSSYRYSVNLAPTAVSITAISETPLCPLLIQQNKVTCRFAYCVALTKKYLPQPLLLIRLILRSLVQNLRDPKCCLRPAPLHSSSLSPSVMYSDYMHTCILSSLVHVLLFNCSMVLCVLVFSKNFPFVWYCKASSTELTHSTFKMFNKYLPPH